MANDESAMKFSVPEMSALVVLMAEAREVSNPELKKLTGIAITGKVRLKLLGAGLVEGRKDGRAFAHILTDKGWRECKNLSIAGRPAGGAAGALYALLAGVHRSLDQLPMSHADFFRREDGNVLEEGDRQHESDLEEHAAVRDKGDVESRVYAAYQNLVDEPGGWVGLADLRAKLAGDSRADVDAALTRMIQTPGVNLIPVANLKSLTQRDRESAVTIGGEDNHALSVKPA